MPELPEVEGFRKYIEGTALGRKVVKVKVHDKKVVKYDPQAFRKEIEGQTLAGTGRVGKYMFLELDGGRSLMIHYGMTGSPRYYRDAQDAPRHERVAFELDNGFTLGYNCPRKFGRITLAESQEAYCREKKIGPDAATISREEFLERIGGRKTAIKAALLNQSILAGVGNWIADEVLYQARVHPAKTIPDLSKGELKAVYDKMIYVIDTALRLEAHFPDFPEDFMIHSRWTDSGRPDAPRIELEKTVVGGRSTYFDPKNQVLD